MGIWAGFRKQCLLRHMFMLVALLAVSAPFAALGRGFACSSAVGKAQGGRGAALRRVAMRAALAPIPVETEVERDTDDPYDSEVRWLADEDDLYPDEWSLLLLDETFEQDKQNTAAYVAGCLVAVLALSKLIADSKVAHAKENYFSVLQSGANEEEMFRQARELQSRNLVVRVVPKATLEALDGPE
mmetsp:Transcript_11310/g.26013  ORF Transcript_11310/g.26013 Transcript_11310/m.26013 type:complete len:186 (+) Transcript_11310:83-640(+)